MTRKKKRIVVPRVRPARPKKHVTALVTAWDGTHVDIDVELVPILQDLWQYWKTRTAKCCQGDELFGARAYIEFFSWPDALHLLNHMGNMTFHVTYMQGHRVMVSWDRRNTHIVRANLQGTIYP